MSHTPLAALRARDPGRQVLVLDMPGHHGSLFCQRAILDVAAAIASAGEDAGLDRPVIAGHSISAVIATVYASAYPMGGVVNVDQVIDMSFLRMMHANKVAITGPRFAQVWPAILASMHIEPLSGSMQRLSRSFINAASTLCRYGASLLASALPRAPFTAFSALRSSCWPLSAQRSTVHSLSGTIHWLTRTSLAQSEAARSFAYSR